uniref:Uncharacterized protein n=1 Tax=Arundo donax TaxID=35708 RepID=A0A0A9CWJ0_ARUDO
MSELLELTASTPDSALLTSFNPVEPLATLLKLSVLSTSQSGSVEAASVVAGIEHSGSDVFSSDL